MPRVPRLPPRAHGPVVSVGGGVAVIVREYQGRHRATGIDSRVLARYRDNAVWQLGFEPYQSRHGVG